MFRIAANLSRSFSVSSSRLPHQSVQKLSSSITRPTHLVCRSLSSCVFAKCPQSEIFSFARTKFIATSTRSFCASPLKSVSWNIFFSHLFFSLSRLFDCIACTCELCHCVDFLKNLFAFAAKGNCQHSLTWRTLALQSFFYILHLTPPSTRLMVITKAIAFHCVTLSCLIYFGWFYWLIFFLICL